jgi:hypothetical protein
MDDVRKIANLIYTSLRIRGVNLSAFKMINLFSLFSLSFNEKFSFLTVSTQLLMVNTQPDDETVGLFHTVLERCLNHEAFDSATRSRINTWRQQVMQMWPPLGSLHEHSRSAPGRK